MVPARCADSLRIEPVADLLHRDLRGVIGEDLRNDQHGLRIGGCSASRCPQRSRRFCARCSGLARRFSAGLVGCWRVILGESAGRALQEHGVGGVVRGDPFDIMKASSDRVDHLLHEAELHTVTREAVVCLHGDVGGLDLLQIPQHKLIARRWCRFHRVLVLARHEGGAFGTSLSAALFRAAARSRPRSGRRTSTCNTRRLSGYRCTRGRASRLSRLLSRSHVRERDQFYRASPRQWSGRRY